MRVLFCCGAGYGHFHPLVPFAQALQRAGHEVAFAAPVFFSPVVEGAGFRHFSVGLDRPLSDVYPRLRTWTGPDRVAFVQSTGAELLARRTIPDLLALAAAWPPDLLVREPRLGGGYGACIAAERLDLPHAVVAINAIGEFVPAGQVAPMLNALRAAYDLPPDPEMAMLYRYLRLCPFPPGLQDPALPVPLTTHYLRPMLGDRSGPEELPAWVATLPDRPVVYLGLGTALNKPEIFRAVIAALRDEALTLIVTVGRDQDPADYGPQPDNVQIERYIPLSLLLSRCDLVVNNAGSGTLVAALTHGLPVVLVPVTADQPENAARCAALRLGRVIPAPELTPELARVAVLDVLGDPSYRRNAERLRDEIATLPGPEYAVALLERLAVAKQPLLTA
jgi:UDP:flavonoid glycosyltransferase YjiC (YdhE family)